jgi:hypothetical protein
MTDFNDDEMRAIILRSLNENAARMAERYKIQRRAKPTGDAPADADREPALAKAPR